MTAEARGRMLAKDTFFDAGNSHTDLKKRREISQIKMLTLSYTSLNT